MTLTFLSSDPRTLRHLERALVGYLDRLHRDGYSAPPDILAMLRTIQASCGQERPKVAPALPDADGDDMSLVVTYAEAGRMLGCSERTVRREVADGSLPSIKVAGRTRRIRVEDIRRRLAGDTTWTGSSAGPREAQRAGAPAPRTVPEDRVECPAAPVLGHPQQETSA